MRKCIIPTDPIKESSSVQIHFFTCKSEEAPLCFRLVSKSAMCCLLQPFYVCYDAEDNIKICISHISSEHQDTLYDFDFVFNEKEKRKN